MYDVNRAKHISGRSFPWRILIPCVISVLMIGICSKSSPLYPMNDWVDVNCFFTVGRGIRHGLIPYLDLYEQKGPLIYFLYALAALISEESFLGVFLVEVGCFAVFLHYSAKTAEVISGAAWTYPLTAAILGLAVPITPAFSHGGSAEELMLPVLAMGIYIVAKAMTERCRISNRDGLLLGILSAIAFWSKYTFCGLFVGLALGTALYYLGKHWLRDLCHLVGCFLLGILIPSVLIVLWFWAHGALPAMWEAYIQNNLTLYSQNIKSGHYDAPLQNLLNNLPWVIPAAMGMLLAFFRRGHRLEALTWCFGAVCLFEFTYLNGRRYPYYALILAVFGTLGPGYLGFFIQQWTKTNPWRMSRIATVLATVLVLGSPFMAYMLSPNTYLMGTEKEDMPQYRFAALIRETEDQTLLNAGFLDGGFYYAAGSIPVNPYFCTLNISLPEMNAAIDSAVRSGETAYVITRQQKLKGNRNYHLIDQCSFPYEGRNWTYYLYRRND